MTRTISFIIGIAVTALAFAVPTALGEGRLAGSNPQDAVTYFKANELSTLVQQPVQLDRRTDAWNRTQAPIVSTQLGTYPDAGKRVGVFEHGIGNYVDANQRGVAPLNTQDGIDGYVDANQRGGRVPSGDVVSASSPGTDFDWSQLGIGFGIGLALALGLLLTIRATRNNRPLAH
jgi:hypothetical protein